ncbi:MAG TPA: polyprenyl synthetase family protein [Nitrososphaerales archaeon]|nr:polyprenyl synthetase family protein [Nitrososphaerales archaeon]
MTVSRSIPRVDEYLESVNSRLDGLFPPNASTTLERAAADSLSGGGKRVRAILALLWCEAFSDDCKPALPLAVAYELAHASALIEDDIIDHSPMRRGKKSVVEEYGLSNAILASNLLLFHVPKMLAEYRYLGSEKVAKLFDLLGEACRSTTWGEFLDLEMAQKDEVSEREYEEMIRLKTSTLLSAPSIGGAIVGGASDSQASLAGKFGELLGMAYQIQDDALDFQGDERILGKPIFGDLRQGKKSLVLIHCVRRCSAEEKDFVTKLANRAGPYSDDEISRVRMLLQKYGSIDYARERSSEYVSQAKGVLASVRDCGARSTLIEMSDYLAARYS